MHDTDSSASARAYRSIRDAILDGSYPPGDMLGESSLAASLEMSRTPVRAALARLQDEGWIVIYPKRGAVVQGLSERTIVDLDDARLILESTAVGRAPQLLRERLADQLKESVDAQRAAFARGDVREFVELTMGFHRGFVEAGGNSVLLELYDRLADRQRFVLFDAGDRLLDRCAEIIQEHLALTDLLRAGDAIGFSAALRTHISEVTTPARPVHEFDGVTTFPPLA